METAEGYRITYRHCIFSKTEQIRRVERVKHKKKLFGLGIGMAAAIALGSAPAKQASAAAVGYINITKITYLYNGAGTSTGVVVSNKKKVRLTNSRKFPSSVKKETGLISNIHRIKWYIKDMQRKIKSPY